MKALVFGLWRRLIAATRPSAARNLRRLRARGETLESLVIREAHEADIPALAHLHVTTWNATYAPMGSKGPPVEVREAQWRTAFAEQDGSWFCYVVENPEGRLVGFAKGASSDNPGFGGELNKIYLLREYQGLGLGRRLVGHVARRFLAQGITSMWLFGDARNPSSRVWVALGGIKLDEDPGIGNYGWNDLEHLAEICPVDDR